MPGAPAARHTSTASRTLGTRPPREFRSVSTLLTFTERRTIQRCEGQQNARQPSGCSQLLSNDVDDVPGPAPDLRLVLPFYHHACERLGSRVPYQQSAFALHP